MPRGRRKSTEIYEEEIAVLDAQIAETTKKLQDLKEKKKASLKLAERNKEAEKWDKIRNSGVNVDTILEIVNKHKG